MNGSTKNMKMYAPNVCLMANGDTGEKIVEYLIDNYPSHIKVIVLKEPDNIYRLLNNKKYINRVILLNENQNLADELSKDSLDYIFLTWWPDIIKNEIIRIPKSGTINIHPSLLPYQRGKHYSFWNIVEDTPFGVTIHIVKEDIDSGEVLFQRKIDKDWEDTGESLYYKAGDTIIKLFQESYEKIISGKYKPTEQCLAQGTFHYGYEIEKAIQINLDEKYKARDLLNLLRAKMSPAPYGPCTFVDDGITYEVRVRISRKDNG